jgi:LysR family hydrogen peroxide-inducible transcriptional activator
VAQLRALVALAEHRNFRQAATELGVSQPSVSAAINGLEVCLGVGLAERSSRKVVLTPAGVEAAERARRILADLDGLVAAAAEQAGTTRGRLRLGVIPTVAPYILAPVLRSLGRRLPEVQLEVTEDQTARLVDELAGGWLDAAVLALPTGAAGFVEVPLYREDFVLLVPPGHPLAGKVGLRPGVVKDLRLLLLDEGHCLSAQALEICRQVGAATDHPARAASLTTIAQLVAAGLGATLLPATALPVETRKGKLAVAQFRPPAPGRRVGLVFRAGHGRAGEYYRLAEHMKRGLDGPGFAGHLEAAAPGSEPARVARVR